MVELTHMNPAPRALGPGPSMGLVHELAPDQRIRPELLRSRHGSVLSVIDGVVYAVVDDDERAMTPGDRVAIPAGSRSYAWNAGDEPARVVTERRAA
jgi:glyoxylate utilization-related uncharacterized protein